MLQILSYQNANQVNGTSPKKYVNVAKDCFLSFNIQNNV